MKQLVYSALALALASAPGIASENEWSSLDQELENLTSTLAAQPTGPKVGGWIISSWRSSGDLQIGGHDQGGFQLDSVRVEITGDAGSDYGYKLSFDFATGVAVLKDAYATWKIGDVINGKMGNFKQPFVRSELVSDNKLLFLQRTALGAVLSSRDLGLALSGDYDTVHWWLAGQNGSDGQANDYLLTGRVTADLMGAGVGKVEGAYGAGDETNLTVGAAIADDGRIDKGTFWGLEASLTTGPFSVSGELVDFDKGDAGTGFGQTDAILANIAGGLGTSDIANTTPWDVTASYMFTDMYELAARYEDSDNDENTTAFHVAVNRYTQGHDIKWTVQYSDIMSDTTVNNTAGDITQIGVGLAVSF